MYRIVSNPSSDNSPDPPVLHATVLTPDEVTAYLEGLDLDKPYWRTRRVRVVSREGHKWSVADWFCDHVF